MWHKSENSTRRAATMVGGFERKVIAEMSREDILRRFEEWLDGALAAAERERELLRETERRCRTEILGVLIDMRDRLKRSQESLRASQVEISRTAQRGWRARIFARRGEDAASQTLAALQKGYELGLERLDLTLEEFNAREIPCEGQAFDPRCMNAIDRQESSALPEGTVMEVHRSGYEWNGELFRPAQVKVSCAPAGKENG
ncbi:MAG: nucleotide exchange factor GrpE [Bryobacteraceae bacterium]